MTESGSQRANCADWNTYYFFRAAAPKDISTCLAAGADPNAETTNGWTPLHSAASAGKDLTVFQVLIAAGADPAAKNYGGRGATPLEIAVHTNENAAVIQTLMAADPAIGSSRDWQLLHTARYGTASEVQTLLDAGGDPHVRGTDGRTLLHMAARNKNAAVTHALLDAGVDSRSKDRIGWTPLHLAASNKTVGVTQALLAAGADPNAKGNNGSIPLHHAARSNGNAAVTQALLAAGADPNAESNNGETPLQWAVRYSENTAVTQALISAAAEPNVIRSRSSSSKEPLPVQPTRNNLDLLEDGAGLTALVCNLHHAINVVGVPALIVATEP